MEGRPHKGALFKKMDTKKFPNEMKNENPNALRSGWILSVLRVGLNMKSTASTPFSRFFWREKEDPSETLIKYI